MISKQEFQKIRKELEKFDEQRERVISTSRAVIKLSKQIIYSCQRGDFKKAESLIPEIKEGIEKLPKEHYDAGIQKVAVQEYVEAICVYEFMKMDRLPTRSQLNVHFEEYLLGLCDVSGELVRIAVNQAINKNYDAVDKIRKFVSELYEEFLKFDLRGGELRKKSDQIKWNLTKIDDLVYEISRK